MTEVLSLEYMAIVPSGSTLSMSVGTGQSLAVVGPSSSGKTHFLRVIAGEERAAQGAVNIHGSVEMVTSEGISRRTRLQALLPRGEMTSRGLRISDLVYKMRLGEAKYKPFGELTPGQVAAFEVLLAMISNANLILIDGQLDILDPWALKDALIVLRGLQAKGVTLVVATNRPDIVSYFDAVIVLSEKQVRFVGSLEDLRRLGPHHTIEVTTEHQEGVRALVAPYEVNVTQTADGYRFEAPEGQHLAARLLLEGYGDVKFIVSRLATLEEALQALF